MPEEQPSRDKRITVGSCWKYQYPDVPLVLIFQLTEVWPDKARAVIVRADEHNSILAIYGEEIQYFYEVSAKELTGAQPLTYNQFEMIWRIVSDRYKQ